MVSVTNGPLFGNSGFDDLTVVELPNLVEGELADLIAAASAPGSPSELAGEDAARSMFEAAQAAWPKRRRLRRPARAAVVVASAASLFATTTALAAASDLPAPAQHVVDGAFHQVGINMAPPVPARAPVSGATPLPPASIATHHKRKGATTHRASGQPAAAVTTNCPAGSSSGNVTSRTGTLRTGGSAPCAITKPTSTRHASSGTTALEKYRKLRHEAGATDGQGTQTTGPTTGSSGSRGGNQSTGSGSGSGTGGNRGGNQGTGSGSGSGTGGNRGGNQGTGSGSGSGTGGNRGGNQGTGSGKGGNKGTGSGKGGTGKKGTGTGKKGTGTGKKGTGTGNGATGGSGKHHRHHGTEAQQGTNSSGQAGTIEDGAPTG